MFALLRQRNYALLWTGGLITRIGDMTMAVGLPIYVYLLTHDVLATAAMVASGRFAAMLVGPVSGVLVDRWDRKRTIVVANLLLTLASLSLLLVRTPSLVWIVYVECVLESALQMFISPAVTGLMPGLVRTEDLPNATTLSNSALIVASLIGPAIGGVVAAKYGLTGMVVVDAASFLLAAALTEGIVVPASPPSEPPREHPSGSPGGPGPARTDNPAARIWRDWIEGVLLLFRHPTLRVVLVAFAIISISEGITAALFPVFVKLALHGGAEEIGELFSARAAGALLGGVLVGRIGARVLSRGLIGTTCIALGSLSLFAVNITRVNSAVGLQLVFALLIGVAAMGFGNGLMALQFIHSPERFRGRIGSSRISITSIAMIAGTAIASVVTLRFDVIVALSVQAVGYIIAGAFVLASLPGHPRAPTGQVAPSVD